jgi:hypothetical protein
MRVKHALNAQLVSAVYRKAPYRAIFRCRFFIVYNYHLANVDHAKAPDGDGERKYRNLGAEPVAHVPIIETCESG